MLAPWKKNYDKPRQYIKKQRTEKTEKETVKGKKKIEFLKAMKLKDACSLEKKL